MTLLDFAGTSTSFEMIRADELKRDDMVQRALIPAHVRKIRDRPLDLDAIGIVTVSRRDDGDYIIDGQHRVQALHEENLGEWEVKCHVYHGLGRAREAALFRLLNTSRKPTAYDDFTKGLVEGDEECLAIASIVQRNGLIVALQSGEGVVSCVAAMRKVFRAAKGTGPAALGFALNVAVQSWGEHSDSVDGHLVGGLGHLYLRYGEEVDRKALIRKLSKIRGGAPGLLGDAKGLAQRRPITVAKAVAVVVVDTYNRGRREQLPTL